MLPVRKEEDGLRITFFQIIGSKNINELIVNSNKLPYNLAGLVTIDPGSDVAPGPLCGKR